jgi:hypothetical protein
MENKKAVVERFVFPVYQRTAANPYTMPAVAVILIPEGLDPKGAKPRAEEIAKERFPLRSGFYAAPEIGDSVRLIVME